MDVCVLHPSHGGYISVDSQRHQQRQEKNLSRTPSPTSSIDDIFSVTSDASSQSSVCEQDEERQCVEHEATAGAVDDRSQSLSGNARFPKPCAPNALPASQLQNPRRSFSSTTRAPPPLPRQEERKVLFVNDLVDSATHLVSVIWPLSGLSCGQTTNNRGVLPLRKYIEETLRRSRTSYSTLQVALYYLVLIKSHVPRHDFSMEQAAGCASMRAMQCGRRMFLAALILASKYLQDRNYSAKAWSKMSGLKTSEINSNERMFLGAVSWKLHIPDSIFKRWTDIVLQFTAQPASAQSKSGPRIPDGRAIWAQLTPLLTPTLDDQRIRVLASQLRTSPVLSCTQDTRDSVVGDVLPRKSSSPTIRDNTPVLPPTPRFLEPKPEILPPTPGLMRMGPLPTPLMTPSSVASSTPAVSTCSSRRPSMCAAMSQASNIQLCRIITDRMPGRSSSLRTPSVAPSLASCSSPESMISDVSRSSRSSSLSTVSIIGTSNIALSRPPMYRSISGAATLGPVKPMQYGVPARPITIVDDSETVVLTDSPTSIALDLTNSPITPLGGSRKRCRSRLNDAVVDTPLQARVRDLLSRGEDIMNIDADVRVAEPQVRPCALRRAMASLSDMVPSPVADEDEMMDRRKRTCFELGPQTFVPDVYMQVQKDVWQGIA